MTRGTRISRSTPPLRGLYPLVDVTTLDAAGLDAVDVAAAFLAAQPALLQLRAKHVDEPRFRTLLAAIAPRCAAVGVPLVVNDRPDLAEEFGAPFVHVGQGDTSLKDVRRRYPGLRVGVSTHTEEQAEAALLLRPDYLAFGPVYATSTKENAEPAVGLERLAKVAERSESLGIPLCAIGGIDARKFPYVAKHAPLIALVGALVGETPAECTERARQFSLLLERP